MEIVLLHCGLHMHTKRYREESSIFGGERGISEEYPAYLFALTVHAGVQ